MSRLLLAFSLLVRCNALHLQGMARPMAPASRVRPIRCGWGPDPVWTSNKIVTITEAASGLVSLSITPPADVADGFRTPGQYVQIRQPGAEKAGFFAIASSPGKGGDFEFLIKEAPPSDWSPGTAWLTGASAGTELEMSQVMGGGFKLGEETLAEVGSVVCFAAGSGISPIRSAIESGMMEGKAISLYYGAQTPEKMAYQDKFESWEKMGVTVTPVISRPEGTGWKGCTGYVQEVAEKAGIPSSCAILLCGMKGMAEAVKELASKQGIPEDKVLTNF